MIGLVILLLCAAIEANAVDPKFLGLMKQSAVSCTYPDAFRYETGADGDKALQQNYTSGSFTTVGSITGAVQLCATLIRLGTAPDVDITFYLYSDDTGNPASLLATSTSTVDAQTVAETRTEYCVAIPSTNLSATTRYHVVLSKAYTDASNTVKWTRNDGGSPTEIINEGATLPPTTDYDTSMSLYIAVKTCN